MTQATNQTDFVNRFHCLTGNLPLKWQQRLFDEQFAKNEYPGVIDLPTGLGKTMVMAIWLIALARNAGVPTRLIYVVDRRTVVDQATDLAKKMGDNCKEALGIESPAISTLRGQLADNREWSSDLSRPAIIIGTVDLIGSALLFSGYRSSFKRRPLEGGLLGRDSLLVLDEAHLSKPFEKLLGSIEGFNKACDSGTSIGKPMRVIRMSATTSTDSAAVVFRLKGDFASQTDDFVDGIVCKRYQATKRLKVITLREKDNLIDTLAGKAIELATADSLRGKRIVVFVRRPDDAKAIANKIREHAKFADSVEVLTGTMRGLERDKLVEKEVFKDRWLNGDLRPDDPTNQTPVFLISTSAGEVGFDLNADHLVCDATTIDSLIQRLGRVNRRGLGAAQVYLVVEGPKKEKGGKPKKLEGLDLAIANTVGLLQEGMDLSPKHIAALKQSDWKDKYVAACSPEPATVELTDTLLDAWSMTSIIGSMPGRPDVCEWLRGIDSEQAQTTVAWRTELELFRSDDPSQETSLSAIFIKHPIRSHESLTVNTGYLLKFFERIAKLKGRSSDLMSTHVAVRLSRGQIMCRTLQQLVDKPSILYADSTLILPAKFGGLDNSGMLDVEFFRKTGKDDEGKPSLDVADHDDYKKVGAIRSRLRILIKRSEDGSWSPHPLPGGVPIPEGIRLANTYAKSPALFNDLKAADFRVRLVQPIKFDDEAEPVQSLVLLSPKVNRNKPEDQSLGEHVGAVENEAKRIAKELKLAEDDPVYTALLFAAKWHDEGKKARIWQCFANNPDPSQPPRGKMAQSRDPRSLRGYRHEFGSLLRIEHPDHCDTIGCEPPADSDARELALHLIATHHGMARPHFSMAVYQDFKDAERDAVHTNVIRRFARLQRKYGWWRLAWLENLLRCADALASADQDAEDDPTDAEGTKQ